MQLKRKLIQAVIELGNGQPATSADTYTLDGYRMQCDIQATAAVTMGNCQARIYGLPLSLINRLTTTAANFQEHLAHNILSVYAGQEGETLSLVYQGDIMYAYGDFDDAPDVALEITSYMGSTQLLQPLSPSFYKNADVSVIMQKLANDAGWSFHNDGVSVKYTGQYLHGTIFQMIRQVADTANINFVVDRNGLTIWPMNQARTLQKRTITPSDYLVGYPRFSSSATFIRTLFLPDLVPGKHIELKNTGLPAADGDWYISSLQHHIAAHMPGGPWFTDLMMLRMG